MSTKRPAENWRDNDPDEETSERWSKDPKNWIWGLFYYNKEDNRIFPPKKIAWMGNTLNFANPKSVLFMIGFILFFVFIIYSITNNQ